MIYQRAGLDLFKPKAAYMAASPWHVSPATAWMSCWAKPATIMAT
ncbi:cytolysin (calcineurin-like family phosphatase) [Mesorhizobium sp. URHB0026]